MAPENHRPMAEWRLLHVAVDVKKRFYKSMKVNLCEQKAEQINCWLLLCASEHCCVILLSRRQLSHDILKTNHARVCTV
jgi:hypothetical protein